MPEAANDETIRGRILHAAMSTFMERGFAGATTLEIASRARVSKRELYAVVGNKEQMLAACIAERGRRMQPAACAPAPADLRSLTAALRQFGATVLGVMCDPQVIAVFRLAASESPRNREVAAALEKMGWAPSRDALEGLIKQAQQAGLLEKGNPEALASTFEGLLWDMLLVRLILGTVPLPDAREIERRAAAASTAFVRLHAREKKG